MPIVTILHDRPSTASALNDDGLVVGNNDRGPFVWRSTDATWTRGSIVELKTFSEHPEGKGTATAINQQSDVVGFCEAIDSNGELVTRAALWPAGAIEPVPLGTLQPAHDAGEFRGNSRAFGINDSGQI